MKLKPRAGGTTPEVAISDHYESRYSGCTAVPLASFKDAGMPRPNLRVQMPNTHYLVDADGKFIQMVTIMPNGDYMGWATCHSCASHVTCCRCAAGFSVARGVEYIYDQAMAYIAKEDWGVTHPNYNGSLSALRRAEWRSTRERVSDVVTRAPRATITEKTSEPAPVGKLQRKLRRKELDVTSADQDVAALVEERMGTPKKKFKLKRKVVK